jgi:hypothetical protein
LPGGHALPGGRGGGLAGRPGGHALMLANLDGSGVVGLGWVAGRGVSVWGAAVCECVCVACVCRRHHASCNGVMQRRIMRRHHASRIFLY